MQSFSIILYKYNIINHHQEIVGFWMRVPLVKFYCVVMQIVKNITKRKKDLLLW